MYRARFALLIKKKQEGIELKKITLVTATVTLAEKGKDILFKNGISSEIKKVLSGTAAGCLYGIRIKESDYNAAMELLKAAGVRIISVKDV